MVPVLPSGGAISKRNEDEEESLISPDGTILGGLFSMRRPRDAGAGFSSGLKNVGKGVAAGAASLFVLPAVGASQQGVGGFFKGVGAGVIAAVALPVTGVCVAGYQLARGLVNTPEAIHERSQGRKWDKKTREWKDNWYSLPEEAERVEAEVAARDAEREDEHGRKKKGDGGAASSSAAAAAGAAGAGKGGEGRGGGKSKEVADRELYDALEVPVDASQDEIRRQYYKLALKYHPDKNPDDPQAKEKFQKLGEAYQVLGDEERRMQYDQYGSAAAQDMPIIDSSLFFMMLFGSEELEPYIGKLKMAMFVEMVDRDSKHRQENISEEMFALEQQRREVKLALALRDRIAAYVEATEKKEEHPTAGAEGQDHTSQPSAAGAAQVAEWKTAMRLEAEKLCHSSFGDAIIEAIGWTYENYATQFLGKLDTFLGLGGRYAKMQAQSRTMGNSWKTANAAVRAALAARQLQQMEQRKTRAKERKKKQQHASRKKKAAAGEGGGGGKEDDAEEEKTDSGADNVRTAEDVSHCAMRQRTHADKEKSISLAEGREASRDQGAPYC
ncbi:UNVERIFIED_CONTAM: hypothetical protein H355_006186 [Colinus virginianus]|nr:hypothetical protein H355_006186 [Colinus virginianus]